MAPSSRKSSTEDALDETAESGGSWGASLAFWVCLVVSATVYALVALSPKLLTFVTLNQQYHENQLRLVAVEKQVEHLERVIDALENDPGFSRELARVDFDAGSPDEHRIPVESQLALGNRFPRPDLSVDVPELPWYTPMIATIATNRQLGTSLLIIDAALLLFAFGFLRTPASR